MFARERINVSIWEGRESQYASKNFYCCLIHFTLGHCTLHRQHDISDSFQLWPIFSLLFNHPYQVSYAPIEWLVFVVHMVISLTHHVCSHGLQLTFNSTSVSSSSSLASALQFQPVLFCYRTFISPSRLNTCASVIFFVFYENSDPSKISWILICALIELWKYSFWNIITL